MRANVIFLNMNVRPSICMHRIHVEDNVKPSREMQRRLNSNMKRSLEPKF